MSPSPTHPKILIQPLRACEIPACAALAAHAFHSDRHTRVKQLSERHPFDLNALFRDMLASQLRSENSMKAVHHGQSGGEVLGWCGCGFRGVDMESVRRSMGVRSAEREAVDGARVDEESSHEEENSERKREGTEGSAETGEDEDEDPIARLHALEDADMRAWMLRLMPPGCACMFITSLAVSPSHQRRGIGAALLTPLLALADALRVYTWVHASPAAWPLLRKMRFEEVGRLELDLDAYAPRAPSAEEGRELGLQGGRWGRCVLRYGKREAVRLEEWDAGKLREALEFPG